MLADEAAIEFQLNCPALEGTPEGVAELEARALIELSVRRGDRGTVEVSCDAERATLRWRSQGKQISTTIAADPDPKRLVDALIAALWRLRIPAEPQLPEPAPVVKRVPPASTAAAPSLAWAVSVGAHAELRTHAPNLLLGPRLNLALLATGWSVNVLGDVAYALDDVAGSRAHSFSVGAAFDLRPRVLRPLTFGVGLLLGRFSASAPTGFGPSEQTATTFASFLRLRSFHEWRAITIALGPELVLYPLRPRVLADSKLVLDGPFWAVGFGFELGWRGL